MPHEFTTQHLAEVAKAARESHNNRYREYERFISVRRSLAEERIRKAADRVYKAELQLLQDKKFAAEQALIEQREKEALEGVGAKYPLGTVLLEWSSGGFSWSRNPLPLKPTGRKARYVAMTRDTRLPDNMADYSRPKVGTFIYQIIKKDGTPGVQIIDSHKDNWYPEGVDPNTLQSSE